MKLWITVALIALMTASAYPREAKAQVMTGLRFVAYCTGGGETHNLGICYGFIHGILEGYKSGISASETIFCVTLEDISGEKAAAMVMEHIKTQQDMATPAVKFVILALVKKWPCVAQEESKEP